MSQLKTYAAQKKLAVLLTLSFALLATLYSIVTPLFEAPDELFHYPMVRYLATQHELPVQPMEPGADIGPWQQEASQPPLYYILAAALTAGIDTSDMETVRMLNPYGAPGVALPDQSNTNVVLHDPATEKFPWEGSALAIHVVRLLSVACGTATVYLSWLLLNELFPGKPWLATAATAIQAFTPMFIFISGAINNDNLVILLCTLALLLIVRLVKNPQNSARQFIPLGIVVGLAILTKESALALLPFAAAAALWTAWQHKFTWQQQLKVFMLRTVAWIVPATVLSGWWYWRNFRLYGDLLGLNAFVNIVKPRAYPLTLDQLWKERSSFLTSYWGIFGWLNVPMPTWIYTLLNTILVIASLGCIWALLRWTRRTHVLDNLTAARLLAAAWPIAVLVALIRWTSMTPASQGRLAFPAASLFSAGLVTGLLQWIPKNYRGVRQIIIGGLIAFLFSLSLAAPAAWIIPTYQPPNPISETEIITLPRQINANFGSHIKLLGYEIDTPEIHTGDTLDLTLYWQTLEPTATEHALFIHILGEGERMVAQRDSLLGGGNLSTTKLEPGQYWAEHYRIPIPIQAYAPDHLSLDIGLYDISQGTRLPHLGKNGLSLGDSLRFASATLSSQNSQISNPINAHFNKRMLLEGYDINELTVSTGDTLVVTLDWKCEKAMDENYTVSVQFIDHLWRKAAQSDSWPQNGESPTTTWEIGQTVEETRTFIISPDVAPGTYTLQIAVYHRDDEGEIHHLPVVWKENQYPQTTLQLTQIRVQ